MSRQALGGIFSLSFAHSMREGPAMPGILPAQFGRNARGAGQLPEGRHDLLEE
jgi:hypothetical protein